MSMQNLEIQFSPVIIKQVKALNFQVDQLGSVLFILFSLYENRLDLLDEFDDYNLQKRAIILYKELELKGLIEEAEEGEEGYFTLTQEGIKLVEFIKGEFTKSNEQVTSEKIAVSGVENLKDAIASDDVDSWIDSWVELFPRGVRTFGKLVRSDKQSCLRKMRVFMKEYGYDKDTIMTATRKYVKVKEDDGYRAMRCAVYFIYRVETSLRDKVSDLAAYCEEVLLDKQDGNSEQSENNLEIMV
jgi:hypothetical protein